MYIRLFVSVLLLLLVGCGEKEVLDEIKPFVEADDYKKVAEILTAHVEQKNPKAMVLLAKQYSEGIGVEKNESKAFELIKKAYDMGEAEAIFLVGIMKIGGVGIEENIPAGVSDLKKADALGWPSAGRVLYGAYYRGIPVDYKHDEAWHYLTRSADLSDHEALSLAIRTCLYGSKVHVKDIACATKYAEKSIREKFSIGPADMGKAYYYGENGYKKDYLEAEKWFVKAHNLGNEDASIYLSEMYRDGGFGLEANFRKALDTANSCLRKYEKAKYYPESCKFVVTQLDSIGEERFYADETVRKLTRDLNLASFRYNFNLHNSITTLSVSKDISVVLNGNEVVEVNLPGQISQALANRTQIEKPGSIYTDMAFVAFLKTCLSSPNYERKYWPAYEEKKGEIELRIVYTLTMAANRGKEDQIFKLLTAYLDQKNTRTL